MLVTQFIKDSVVYMSNGNIDGGFFRECEYIAHTLGCKFKGFTVNNDNCLKFMFVSK